MSLERQWKSLVEDLRRRGQDSSFAWINAGARIVEEYNNRDDTDERILFIRCTSAETLNGGWHPPLVYQP